MVDGVPVVLGSGSPRRARLLAELGVEHRVVVADVDEDNTEGVAAIARQKFDALASLVGDATLLTADTLVTLDGEPLGKPRDRADAISMVQALSGRTHVVETAVCIGGSDAAVTRVVATEVSLRELTLAEVEDYVASGAADDKAGALALQDEASSFVASSDGCWSNVIGLPLCVTAELLGVALPEHPLRHGCRPECPLPPAA